ncbi:YolD-like family protein, partial [Staphylococcus aureus]|uniref:YolD-like family protein n=1 Tax=Staphylococcus aureus TaxID=1280 RepID=UPI0021AC8613
NHTKPNIGGKSSIFHPKKTKIEDIFHGCLRFFGSKGTNGSAPQYAQPVEVKFYNNGFVDSVRLTIYRIDAINYEIDGYVYNQQQRQKISIFDILDIVLLP